METNSSLLIKAWGPIVKTTLGSGPDELNSRIGLGSEVLVDPVLIFRMSDHPNLVGAGQLPRPIPCESGFGSQTGTARMAYYQDLHGRECSLFATCIEEKTRGLVPELDPTAYPDKPLR